MSVTIVDTDILIDIARGVEKTADYFDRLEQDSTLAISIVTQMELIVGSRNKIDLRNLDRFLARFQILKITDAISEQSVELLKEYRLSHGLLIADSLIAATAIVWNCSLASKNQKDYRFISILRLLPYSG